MVSMQTITLKGLRPYDDSELIEFKNRRASGSHEPDAVMDYVKGGKLQNPEMRLLKLLNGWISS